MMKQLLPVLLLAGTVVLAQPGRGMHMKRLTLDDDLKLTKEQQEQITQLRSKTQLQAIDLRAEMQKLRLELREQLRAERPNRKAIDATLEKITAKRAAMQKLRIYQHLDMRELLTPEQRQLFDARPWHDGYGLGGGRKGRSHFHGGRLGRW